MDTQNIDSVLNPAPVQMLY